MSPECQYHVLYLWVLSKLNSSLFMKALYFYTIFIQSIIVIYFMSFLLIKMLNVNSIFMSWVDHYTYIIYMYIHTSFSFQLKSLDIGLLPWGLPLGVSNHQDYLVTRKLNLSDYESLFSCYQVSWWNLPRLGVYFPPHFSWRDGSTSLWMDECRQRPDQVTDTPLVVGSGTTLTSTDVRLGFFPLVRCVIGHFWYSHLGSGSRIWLSS